MLARYKTRRGQFQLGITANELGNLLAQLLRRLISH